MRPQFSIIIPVYNASSHLEACISSILKQTFSDFELLLIDDGSLDGSGDICKCFSERDDRIFVFHQENSGVSVARNRGIENASGRWICFIDSDDFVDELWLENYALNLDADLICQGAVVTDGLSSDSIHLAPSYTIDSCRDDVICYLVKCRGILNSPWSKCYRSDIIKKLNIRFRINCNLGEDLIFVLNFLTASRSLKVIKYSGYHYRRENSKLTKKFHPPDNLLVWKRDMVSALSLYCKGDRSRSVFNSVFTNEFAYLSFYVIEDFDRIPTQIRYGYYNFFREYRNNILMFELSVSKYIYKLIKFSNGVFDFILSVYSSLYKYLRKIIKK